jgi:AAA domain
MSHPTLSSFLSAFFPDENEEIHFRAFKPKGAAAQTNNGPVLITGTRRQLAENQSFRQRLKGLNESRGLYLAPNAGGSKDERIVRFNAAFCEKDDLPIAEQHRLFDSAPLSPSIRVESRRSVHAYWLLKGNCSSDQWVSLQEALIDYFRSDPKIRNPSRVMRLPYFDHLSEGTNGCVVRQRVLLVQFHPEQRYSVDQILQAFSPPSSEPSRQSSVTTVTTFMNWSDLNAELRRRLLSHSTCKIDQNGQWAHCKGICHNGKGNTALALNVASGSYFCQAGCTTAAILRAFGLPATPGCALPGLPTNREKSEASVATLRCVADVEAEHVHWLWYPYIPQGKVTLVEGDPGVGKSWMVLALTTAIAAGQGLPNVEKCDPRSVLLLSSEDGLADTIRPRLDSLKADVSRIFALDGPVVFDSGGLSLVAQSIEKHQPRLVIVDPLVAYLGANVDLHRANETRLVMAALSRLAEGHRCAIVVVRHLTKSGKERPIYRGLGSIDITAACRSVLPVGADPDQPAKRAVVQIKNNLAEMGSAIGYTLSGGTFSWTGLSNLTADRLLSAGHGDEERSALEEAQQFLLEFLSGGSQPAKDVERHAKKAGVSARTLWRAKRSLGITSQRHKEVRAGTDEHQWIWAFQRAAWRAPNNPAIKAAKKICLAAFPWILSLKGFPRFICPRLPTIPLLAALLPGMAALVLMQTLLKELMNGERYECR